MATSVEPERGARRAPSRPAGEPFLDGGRAHWGLRGKVNDLFGSASIFGPSAEELRARDDITAIRCALPARQSIVVANTEGGMGKTPTVVMLANLFGVHRGGDVVAWDVAGVRGNLGQRSATNTADGHTVWGLLADTDEAQSADAALLARYLCRQPTGDEILASDRAARHMESITTAELVAIGSSLAQHRQITVLDTGNDDRATAWTWATSTADQLVIPLPYRRGAASAVTSMLATLSARGLDDLVQRAIVIASPPPRGATATVVDDVRHRLSECGIRTIIDVPFDESLASWERIDHARLSESTVRAWTHAAAVVAQSLAVGPSKPARVTAPAESFDVTTAALRERAAASPTPEPEKRKFPVRGAMACAATVLAVATAVGVFQLAARPDSPVPAPVAAQSIPSVPSERASGPAVIQAYDDQYYTNRSAEGAASLWTLPEVPPDAAAIRMNDLQRTIDKLDPAITHRLEVAPTSNPLIFDAVLTLTTPDGIDHDFFQQFKVEQNNGVYSIADKDNCEQKCPAP